MRIRLTHSFDDRQLRGIARVAGSRRKRKATRTECVQFVTRSVERAAAEAIELLSKFEVSHDPAQLLLADALAPKPAKARTARKTATSQG